MKVRNRFVTVGILLLLDMREHSSATDASPVAVSGLLLAGLGVVAFSMTFPATVFALRGFDPLIVGAGRSVGAAGLAGATLLLTRAPWPSRQQLPGLVNISVGVGVGFGVLSAIALGEVSASHAAVVGALLPVATAIFAVLRAGERPSLMFWVASITGAAAVTAYAIHQGVGRLKLADGLLLAALVIGGLGYAEGGRLSRSMPGWRVISWAVLLALPVSLPITVLAVVAHPPHPGLSAVAGLLYVSSISMFFGFFAWYRGLAKAGIARASQLQLAQPFLTLGLAAWLLGERAGPDAFVTAAIVIACVVATQRARYATAAVSRPARDPA